MAVGFVLITLAVIAGSTWAFIELKIGLDRAAQDRDFLLHLGRLPGAGVPADHRGMARAQGRHHDRDGGRLLRLHLGRARPARRPYC